MERLNRFLLNTFKNHRSITRNYIKTNPNLFTRLRATYFAIDREEMSNDFENNIYILLRFAEIHCKQMYMSIYLRYTSHLPCSQTELNNET